VWLDGTDVVLGYQPVVDLANSEIRIGMRLEAVWASEGERRGRAADSRVESNLIGWIPTGEADVDDPGLVNRIN